MARRSSTPPRPPASKVVHTAETLQAAIGRLQKRVDEVEDFDPRKITEKRPPEIAALSSSIQSTLARAFGENTEEYIRFSQAANLQWSEPLFFSPGMPPTPLSSYIDGISHNKQRSLAQLKEAIKVLQEDLEEIKPPAEIADKPPAQSTSSKKVFIVHGRDNDAKIEVARFLGKIGLDEIILHERPNMGRHLLTKFQEESEVATFAVILMTPDDEGGLVGEAPKKRARQNVVFEFGFFAGRLGSTRVVALMKGNIEKPSDIDGLTYINLDPGGIWKMELAKELKAAKVPFDLDKVFEA